MDNLVINRKNFKQNRVSYGITLDEIAKRCGLVSTTVSNFERFEGKYTQTRVRDDNERLMVRALEDIIEERIGATFVNAKKDEPEKKDIQYDRKFIGDKIRKWCIKSEIALGDFCAMCGINTNFFNHSISERSPYFSEQTAYKIMNATGWTKDVLIGPEDIPVKESEKKPEPAAPKMDIQNLGLPNKGNITKSNEKLTCENGKYFYEYTETVVRSVKRSISKEEFLSYVSRM